MPHLDLVLQVEKICIYFIFGQGGERQRSDELLARARQHAAHAMAGLAQQAHQLDGLVGGDAATDDQKDAPMGHDPIL